MKKIVIIFASMLIFASIVACTKSTPTETIIDENVCLPGDPISCKS